MIDERTEVLKLSIGSFLGVIASFVGETYKHLMVLVIFMIIDTIFGWIKGFKKGKWTSKKAKWGIAGKIVELALIFILYVLNWAFKIDFLVYIGLYYFMAVELASILENYASINGNLPKGFVEILKKLQFSIGTAFVEKIKKVLDNIFNNDDKGGK